MISVIVPVYNNEEYFEECLRSILSQTYKDLELIIVNDGSTDMSLAIANRYASIDSRVKIFTQSNNGPSSARNLALDNCNGRYITFVDADDVIDAHFLEYAQSTLEHSHADIAVLKFTKVNTFKLRDCDTRSLSQEQYLKQVLYQCLSDNSVCGKLYKAEIFNGVRFLNMRYEDLEIFPRMCLNSRSVVLSDEQLYYYRPNDKSFINSFSPGRIDALKAADMIVRTLEENKCSAHLIKAAKSRKLAASFNIFLLTFDKADYSFANRKAWNNIKTLRRGCLLDSNVRTKIKLGIIASLFGRQFTAFLNRIVRLSS